MKKQIYLISVIIIFLSFTLKAQDSIRILKNSLKFQGQLSTWAHINDNALAGFTIYKRKTAKLIKELDV